MAVCAARTAARAARAARLSGDRATPGALRDPLHEHRGAGRRRRGRRRAALALPASTGACAARVDVRPGRARATRAADVRRQRGSLDRADRRRVGLDVGRRRQADAAGCRSGGSPALSRDSAGEVPRGARHVLVRAVRGSAADARPRPRPRGAAARRDELRPGHRDRRCTGPLGRAPPARGGRGRAGHAGGSAQSAAGPGPPAVGHPDALGRRPDTRHARPAGGRCAREVLRHPRLHGRAGHAGRRAQPRRVLAARAARSRRRCGRSRRRRAASSSRPTARRASTRSTRISPPGSAARTNGAS